MCWNSRFTSRTCSRQTCSNRVMPPSQNLWGMFSSTLLNLSCKELRQKEKKNNLFAFSKKGGQFRTCKLYLKKWPVNLYFHSICYTCCLQFGHTTHEGCTWGHVNLAATTTSNGLMHAIHEAAAVMMQNLCLCSWVAWGHGCLALSVCLSYHGNRS